MRIILPTTHGTRAIAYKHNITMLKKPFIIFLVFICCYYKSVNKKEMCSG